MFFQELSRATRLPPAFLEAGLVGADRARPRDLRLLRRAALADRAGVEAPRGGRRRRPLEPPPARGDFPPLPERDGVRSARRSSSRGSSCERTGVVFRKTLAREKQPIPWRDIARVCRTLEARGEVRGGRFVAGFDGEQYALPEAVTLLRAVRRRGDESGAV